MRYCTHLALCLLLIATPALAAEPAAEQKPAAPADAAAAALKSLTDPRADEDFHQSLALVCKGVLASRHANQPFASDCGPWPGMQVPTASMLGLILIGEGNTLAKGPHAATLRKIVKYVRMAGPVHHESIDKYRTWVLAFATIFLSEVQRIAPSDSLKVTLQNMVKKLEESVYPDGGWGHTLEHEKNNYGAFVAVSIWAVAAIEAAQQRGVKIDEKILARQFDWLRKACAPTTGGARYAADGRSYVSPGRTAGLLWLMDRYDRDNSRKQLDLGAKFLTSHAAFIPEGHASGMMNFAWGALAAAQLTGPPADAFWLAHAKSILDARRQDAGFDTTTWRDLAYPDRPGATPKESKHSTPTADQTAGDNWTAVWLLTSWQAARGKSLLCLPKQG